MVDVLNHLRLNLSEIQDTAVQIAEIAEKPGDQGEVAHAEALILSLLDQQYVKIIEGVIDVMKERRVRSEGDFEQKAWKHCAAQFELMTGKEPTPEKRQRGDRGRGRK